MSYVSVDIDIDDFLSSCGRYDRMELIKALIEDGHLPSQLVKGDDEYILPGTNWGSADFDKAINNLVGRGWQLSKEEEEYIINISNRFL